ncbi:MAG: hypothetical protein [Bacteriophage sp.]|nr:MAG: hypothetical protein [Bacteriophage sp.]
MAQNNNTIMAKAWLAGTNDFQQRIPDPTQAGISATMSALFQPMNGQYFNQFMDILVNRIAYTYVRGQSYKNPLAVFKGNKINYGSTIQEIAPKWIKAHSYEDDAETLLKLHRPESEVWYHSQNRRDQYPISVNVDELRTAFTDEYGLNNLVAQLMNTPNNADEYDEFNIMKNLIAEYETRWGFYKYHLDDYPADDASGKAFLTALQTLGGKLQFPSSVYSGTDIPVFAQPSELVLLVTPEAQASLNVNTLAALFNVDLAKVSYRTVLIDEFPIPDAVALLTTEDFFVCHDTLYNTTSFWNPQTLNTTYWLNHWGVYSVSPFVPAILFTTAAGTVTPTIKQAVTGLSVTAEPGTVELGGSVSIVTKLKGTIAPADSDTDVLVRPDACIYNVSAETPAGDDPAVEPAKPVQLNVRTRVDNYGVLHVQKTGLKSGDVITVTATSTYVNPSGATVPYTGIATVTIE